MMRKVLIFTYYWPPAGGPGVQRFLKFSKYLRLFHWEPIIITPREGSYPAYDPSLANDIPEGIKVIKTATFEPFALYNKLTGKKGKSVPVALIDIQETKNPVKKLAKYIRANFFVPDARIGWVRYALQAGIQTIRTDKIDAIITTGPPHSAHLIGLAIKKKTPIPWIADFRDPWTNMYYNAFFPRTKKTRQKDQELEDKVLAGADAVTVVSNGMQQEFKDRARLIKTIWNGFDESDLQNDAPKRSPNFEIVYTGSYKPNQDVPGFWKAINHLNKEIPDFGKHCRVNITGIIDESIKRKIDEMGISHLFTFDGFVSHREATTRMINASLLFFVIPDTKTNKLIMPGKMFEYLASRTPMISFGPPDGDAAKALKEAGRDAVIDYNDEHGAMVILEKYFREWTAGGGQVAGHTGDAHMKFSRQSLTRELALLLDKISNG